MKLKHRVTELEKEVCMAFCYAGTMFETVHKFKGLDNNFALPLN